MLRQYKFRNYDIKLILFVIALSTIGVLAVGSAQEAIQEKQILGMITGIILMLFLSVVNYSFILNFYWVIYIVNILLLISVLLFGVEVNGAKRWLTIGGIQFQPSETAKILLILFFAQFIMKYRKTINSPSVLLGTVVLFLIPVSLIYKEPDLSTSIIVCTTFCVIMFMGGLSYRIIGTLIAIVIPAFVTFIILVLQPNQKILEDYQVIRILAWIQPEKYADSAAYQTTNAMIAIGSGMLWGKGLNNNEVASVKNGNFIAEPQTDFIFAIIGEELGFVGGCAVILLLLGIIVFCLLIAKRAKDLSGKIIASSLAALIGFQGFINIAVATGLFPNTGIPLPFVSAGLTSLVSLYVGIGILLNIGLQAKK